MRTKNITLSFVIPVYNEEKRIDKTFEALDSLVLPRGLRLKKVIFVNDGSKDTTSSLLYAFVAKKHSYSVQIISYQPNHGKGYAIQQGMKESDSDYTLFFDADMSTPLSELDKLAPLMKDQVDVIVGTRKNGQSTVIRHQPKYRELLGRGFTLLTQLALNTWISDFTCGFKAFSRASKETIFTKAKITGWGYDAELVFLAKIHDFTLVEKAVLWSNDERTKVNLVKAIPQTLLELAKIRFYHSLIPFLHTLKSNSGVAKRTVLKA